MIRSSAASSAPRLALLAPLVAGLVAAAACDHAPRVSSDPARDKWAEIQPRATAQLSRLREQETVITRRIEAVRVPEGTVDPQLSALIDGLATRSQAITAAVAAYDRALTRLTAEVEQALARRDKIAAQRAVDNAATSLDQTGGTARASIDAAEAMLSQAEGAMQRTQRIADADVARLTKIAGEGGAADIFDIEFITGTSDLDPSSATTNATLARLTRVAGLCDQIRLTITVHTAHDGDAGAMRTLSTARASALRDALVRAGVASPKIHRAIGAGFTSPLVEEPAPGTPAAAAIPPDELEGRRRKNRRVTITVDNPCPAPAAAVAPAPDTDGTAPDQGGAAPAPDRAAPAPQPGGTAAGERTRPPPPTAVAPAAGNRVRRPLPDRQH